jgi:salicylate 5-hydroxylase large subunit
LLNALLFASLFTYKYRDEKDKMTESPAQSSGPHNRQWPEKNISSIPLWVYSDPEIYQLEQERVFGGANWNYVALSAEIPKTGDFVRSNVGDKSVVVTRGTDGAANVFVNRCAHRAAAFCKEDHGNATSFMCPYHQWTYDLKGNLTGVPFRRGYKGQGGLGPDFKMPEHGAQQLKVTERNGVIFAAFDHNVESFEEYLGPNMLGYFDRVFDGREIEVLGYTRQRIDCNWKLMFENLKDPYHASVLHVFLITFGLFRLDQESAVEMDETGRHGALISRKGAQALNTATQQMTNFRSDLKLKDPRLIDVAKEYPGDISVVMQTVWPNLILQQQSNTLAMRHLVPRGPNAFDLNWTFFGYADDTPEMRERRIRQANLMGPAGLVSMDDSEILSMSQKGIRPFPEESAFAEMGGVGTEDTKHMITEAGIRGFYKHYIKVMGL